MLVTYKGMAHPWLCDVMGHLTTRHYVAMFDDASYHLLLEIFDWSASSVAEDGLGWADVRHVIEYQAEVSSGDLDICLRLSRLFQDASGRRRRGMGRRGQAAARPRRTRHTHPHGRIH